MTPRPARHPLVRARPTPSRRAIAHGAAWAVPVIAVGAAAPWSAASTACASLPPFSTTEWGLVQYGLIAADPASFEDGTFVDRTEPEPGSAVETVAGRTLEVTGGVLYVFSYRYTAVIANMVTMSQVVLIDGVEVPGSAWDTSNGLTEGFRSFSWVADSTHGASFEVLNKIVWNSGSPGDDIITGPITVTCNPPLVEE